MPEKIALATAPAMTGLGDLSVVCRLTVSRSMAHSGVTGKGLPTISIRA